MFEFLKDKAAEVRQAYDEIIVSALLSRASSKEPVALEHAAVETAAGFISRGLSVVEFSPDHGFTPGDIDTLARDLVERGESVWIRDGGSVLRMNHWDITGSTPGSFAYNGNVPTPNGDMSVRRSGGNVYHFQYSRSQARPWEGVSPISKSYKTVELMSLIEGYHTSEMMSPVGNILPTPINPTAPEMASLKEDLQGMRGKTALVESAAGGWGTGTRPIGDWDVKRLGPNTAQPSVELRRQVTESITSAFGIPIVLLNGTEGTAIREAWRLFLSGTIGPLAKRIAAELSLKSRLPTTYEMAELKSSDLASRARAVGVLVTAGYAKEEAARMSGF